MISFRDIQPTARDVIAASDYFSNAPDGQAELVIADVGLSKDDIETALNKRGIAVVVDFPTNVATFRRSPGVTHAYVTVPVHVQVNPVANADPEFGAGKNVLLAVEEIANALMAYDPEDDEADRFELEEDAIDLLASDAGLVAFVLWFRKLCVFS